MKHMSGGLVSILSFLAAAQPSAAQQVDYNRAERFVTWHTSPMISGDRINPQWMEDGTRFWYRNKTGTGHEFVLVSPAAGTRAPLFDHYRMAAAMSLAADTSFIGDKLPFDSFDFVRDETAISFRANKKGFECDLTGYTCVVGDTVASDVPFIESPDRQWEAFVHEYNLWVRPTGGGDSVQLTTDGEEYWGY